MPRTGSVSTLQGLTDLTVDPESAELLVQRRSGPRSPLPTGVAPRFDSLEDISAVLFDVYGTLFVSGSGDVGVSMDGGEDTHFLEALADAVPHLVGMRGHPRELPEGLGAAAKKAYFDAIAASHGESRRRGIEHPEVDIRRVWQRACAELLDAGRVFRVPTEAEAERLALAYELRANPAWPMPEAVRTLQALAAAGLPLGIVSNAQFFTPLLFPALMGMEPRDLGFLPELCSYSYALGEAKPSPALFVGPLAHLREGYGISPSRTLYVGNDMRNDIATARQAGCRTCLFAGDARSLRLREDDPGLSSVEPDAVIRSLPELLSVLSPGGRTLHA